MEVDQEKVRLEAEAEELAEAEMTPEVEARLVRRAGGGGHTRHMAVYVTQSVQSGGLEGGQWGAVVCKEAGLCSPDVNTQYRL
jgi:hypothetical protein